MADNKSTKFPENVIQVSDIGEGEYLGAARTKLIRLLELQEEFYNAHPVRRLLRKLHLLPESDPKARAWALRRYEEELLK
jgi:hypothetical protein